MVETIAGAGLMVLGAVLFRGFSAARRKMEAMASTETSTVAFLNSLARSMAEGVGAGALRYAAEVKGVVVCPEPLVSEVARVACVHYAMKVRRRYEETVVQQDKDGKDQPRTRTGTETVAANTRAVPFYVDDGTGRIRVDPDRAEWVAEKVVSRFEAAGGGGEPTLGGLTVDPAANPAGQGRSTIGYQFEEHAVPVGREVYVMGEATDQGGELAMGAPAEAGRFVISVKGEAALLQDHGTAARWRLIGAIACGVSGIGAVLAGWL